MFCLALPLIQIIHSTACNSNLVFELDTQRSSTQAFKDYPQAVYVGNFVFFIFSALHAHSIQLVPLASKISSKKGEGPADCQTQEGAQRRPQHVCPQILSVGVCSEGFFLLQVVL